MKNHIFSCSFNWLWLDVGWFGRIGPEIDYFYSEIGLEVTFWTTLQNRKPQMTSFAWSQAHWKLGPTPSLNLYNLSLFFVTFEKAQHLFFVIEGWKIKTLSKAKLLFILS